MKLKLVKPVRYSFFSIYLLIISGFLALVGFVTVMEALESAGYRHSIIVGLLILMFLGPVFDGIDQMRLRKRG